MCISILEGLIYFVFSLQTSSFAVTLQVLYKLKTAKIFEKPKNKTLEGQEDDPFAIYLIFLDQDSRLLCLAGATHVMLFKFSKQEVTLEVPVSVFIVK